MADLKISQLTDGGASQATDEYVVARSGSNFRIDGASVAAAATSVGTLSSLTVSGSARIANASGNKIMQLGQATPSANDASSLEFQASSTQTNWAIRTNWNVAGALEFNPSSSAGGTTYTTPAMYLTSSGNLAVDTNTLYVDAANNRVGVGTASPSNTLDVITTTTVTNTLVDTLRISAITTNTAAAGLGTGIVFSAERPSGEINLSRAAIYGVSQSADESGYLSFWTRTNTGSGDFNEKMRLDASGNLGLGVTPSAWTTFKVFQSQRSAFASYSDGSPNAATVITTNAFYDGNWKYIESIGATNYEQATSPSAAHKWFVAPSGTAGGTISFTQAMTLDASGNLTVGAGTINATRTSGDSRVLATAAGVANTVLGFNNSGSTVGGMVNNVGYVNVLQAYPLVFGTDSTERARITSGGYFKASNDGAYNDSAGAYHEFLTNAGNWALYTNNKATSSMLGVNVVFSGGAPNGTGNPFLQCTDGTTRAVIRSNGGLANYQANNVDLSDIRTKTDITPAASMWDKVAALEIVAYKYIDQTHDDVNLGVIAQQVETVEPVWVDADGFGDTPEGEEPLKTVYTKDITFAAIKALQEAMARIEALEVEVAALKANA